MKQVLTALETKNQSALETLTITDDEYMKYVWPGLAAKNPGGTAEIFLTRYRQGSAAGIATNLKDFGGRRFQLVKVSLGRPIKQTKSFRLLPAPNVTVRDEQGQEHTIRLAGAVLEHDGTCKVSTYYVTPTTARE